MKNITRSSLSDGVSVAAVLVATMLVSWSSSAIAETAVAETAATSTAEAAPAVGEITVTAQRRSENLQKVPISVTAATAETLEKSNVSSVADLNMLAPSLTFAEEGGWSQPHLRGIGTTATGPGIESAVAVYIDGVYQASMVGGAADFGNVKAVEVINGPQGTLFGRNATGGLIQIRTLDPSHTASGNATLGYGSYETLTASAYLTGEVTKNLAANVAVDFSDQASGYGRNEATGKDIDKTRKIFIRSKLLWEPGSNLKFTLAGNYGYVRYDPVLASAPGTVSLGGTGTNLRPHDLNGYYDPYGYIRSYGVSLTSEWDLEKVHIESITAFQRTESLTVEDGALTPNPSYAENISLNEPHEQFSQELQFSSPSGGAVTWTAGLYYFHETAKYDPVHLYGGLYYPVTDLIDYATIKTDSFAAYGQATWAITPETHLTGGIRFTTERRSAFLDSQTLEVGSTVPDVTASGHKWFHAPTWRVSLDHSFSPQILAYASYNRGYKSGGFNPGITNYNAVTGKYEVVPYEPEKLDAYEIGVKAQTRDKRFRLNVAGFLYNYSNIQVQSFQTGILDISNGARARFYGADIAADAVLTPRFSLHAGASLLHATFTYYPNADYTTSIPLSEGGGTAYSTGDATGNRVPFAPKLTITASATYTIPSQVGDFQINTTYNYNSGWNAEPDGRLKQAAYSLLGAQVGWTSKGGKFGITLWGKNLLNTDYAVALFSQYQGDVIQWAPPRTFGATGKVKF